MTNKSTEATRKGIHREAAAEWINLARRYDRLNRPEDAQECRAKAESIRREYPHLQQ